MKEINNYHNNAMDKAELAFIKKNHGKLEEASELFSEAYKLEKKAALKLLSKYDMEPTRSILFRSAASLAYNYNDYTEAEKMIAHALTGEPPEIIREELRNLYDQINFERHLKLKGIKLEDNELQFSISGNSVGYGFIDKKEFNDRLNTFEKMTIRTAERTAGLPFRKKGPPRANITASFKPFISVPRASSFVVTLRFGSSQKSELFPDYKNVVNTIDEIIEDINLINNGKEHLLKEKIENENYFENFIMLSKKLAPDGKNVKQIGLTCIRNGKKKTASFTRIKNKIKPVELKQNENILNNEIEIQGRLSFADAEKNKIKIIDRENNKYNVIVPDSLLNDIVKPYWDAMVVVKGVFKEDNKTLDLKDIQGIEE